MREAERRERANASTQWFLPTLGILLAIGLAWGVGSIQSHDQYDHVAARKALEAAALERSGQVCRGQNVPDVAKCVAEEMRTARQIVHEARELKAQERSASSALIAVVISLFSLIVTAVGVYFLKRTLDATLQAVADTSDATKAMIRQNELMEDAQRPWLSVRIVRMVNIGWDAENNLRCDYVLEANNSGSMPAVVAIPFVGMLPLEDGNFSRDKLVARTLPMAGFLGRAINPGATEQFSGKSSLIDTSEAPSSGYNPGGSIPGFMVGFVYFGPKASRANITMTRLSISPNVLDRSTRGPYRAGTFGTIMD